MNYNIEAISKKENENKGGSINDDDSNSEIFHILAKNTSSGKYFKIISVQLLLVGVRRIPNSNNFGLKKIGVRVNENGFIITDEYLETIVKGIFALEDAGGRYQSKQYANLEAEYALTILFIVKIRFLLIILQCLMIFLVSAQVAGVGNKEQELKQKRQSTENLFINS